MSNSLSNTNKENIKELGMRIRRIRREKNLTQKALGQMINKSYEAIRKYENGDRQPPLDVLKELSRVLEVPINTFIDDNSSKPAWNLSESEKLSTKRNIMMTNAIESLFKVYGYEIENKIPSFSSEEQAEDYYNDKSNIILNAITPNNKTIELSIEDWEKIYSSFDNYLKFELFKLDNMSDK
ncbi:helix-turn-helix domain-containing protein [Clostridium butyricum]|uniref:helix-turn-helix domain-containing protein n=1 Tax=Clostridium butyricum TaxID=1492 RepID=UPI001CA910AE|nr:helix-turn-helix domain-containing protein [Clostridium butyricum]MBZ0312750.1 helix-turn-helix domain-containing protein [Clostridium butyricum]